MNKTALVLMVITLVSKVTGLIREQFFAYYLGTGKLIDVYNTSTAIPFILFGIIIYGMTSGFIPVYTKIQNEDGTKRANQFTSNLINIMLVIVAVFVVLLLIFAPLLVSLFAPGYEGEKREMTIHFTRILSLGLFSTTTAAIFIGFLQIRGRFIIAEVHGIFMNFLHVTFLVLAFYFKNFYILAYGFLITEFIKYFLFPIALKQERYKHIFKIDLKDKYLKNLLNIAIPILAMAALDLSTIADQALASNILRDGGVSAMKYGGLIIQLISGVVTISITTAIYPKLSLYSAKKDLGGLKRTLMEGVLFAFILIIPAVIGVMILSTPMIKLLFQRGNFNDTSTMISSGILFFYGPTLIGNAINILFNRANYSLENTNAPVIIALVQVILNLILNFVFSYFMGLNGLALATSVSAVVGGILSITLFYRKYGNLRLSSFIKSTVKLFIASLLMGIATYFIYHSLSDLNELISMTITIVVSMIVYLFIILFMRIPYVMKMVNIIYKKIRF